MSLDSALRAVVAEVFSIAPDAVNDDLSPDVLTAWDSFGHIRLVAALEERFGITLETTEAMSLFNVGAIRELLVRRGVVA